VFICRFNYLSEKGGDLPDNEIACTLLAGKSSEGKFTFGGRGSCKGKVMNEKGGNCYEDKGF
jgi:hypothetical protein